MSKAEPGPNKEVGRPLRRPTGIIERFEDSSDRRADRDDAAASSPRRLKRISGRFRPLEPLRVHSVRRDVVRPNGQKSARPHVEGQRSGEDPPIVQARDHGVCKVKTSRRCRHRADAVGPGKDRLVPLRIVGFGRSSHIGRQGELPVLSGEGLDVAPDLDSNPAPISSIDDRNLGVRAIDPQTRARPERLVRLRQRPPCRPFRFDEQKLDAAAGRLSADQARGAYARVVDDQEITRAQEFRQLRERVVGNITRTPIERQKATRVATGRRMSGDRFRRKNVVKLGQPHRSETVPALFHSGWVVMLGAVRYCPHCFSIYTSQVDFCGIDGTKLREETTDPLVGRVLDRYRVLERLGLGAMGCVYRVAHTFLEHEYAMKVLFGDLSANKRIVERFRREAQVVSKVRHPNVVAVTDFGTTDNGLTFLVMEYVRGRTLADIITAEAPFTPTRAANIARQIAAGLGEAHRQEFIHRDVKPSNVMVWSDGHHEYVKLVDFGIVGLVPTQRSARITGSGHFVGTPLYMAPEQSRDPLKVSPAADLYGLGIMLFEMLTGQPPFDADSVVDLFIQHATAPVPQLPASQGLELLVHWLLEKRADRRPNSADAVIAELDRLSSARTYSLQLRPADAGFRPSLDAATLDGTFDGPQSTDLKEAAVSHSAPEYPEVEPTPALPLPPIGMVPAASPSTIAHAPPPSTATPSLAMPSVNTPPPIQAPVPARPPAMPLPPFRQTVSVDRAKPGPRATSLDFEFLRGRLDYLSDRLRRAVIIDATRTALETRLRRLQAGLRVDLDERSFPVIARDLADIERDLNAAVGPRN